jgi:hypothetical protein
MPSKIHFHSGVHKYDQPLGPGELTETDGECEIFEQSLLLFHERVSFL